GADELEGAHGEERRQRMRHRPPPAQSESRRGADQRLLADPHVHEARPERGRQTADRRPVLRRHHDHVVAPGGERLEGLAVAHRTILPSVTKSAAPSPCNSRSSSSTSSAVKSANQRSARRSRFGNPLPRTVRATTALGRPEVNGTAEKTFSSAAKS